MDNSQDYKNHVRWLPVYHFVLAPMILINLIYSILRLVQDPGWDRWEFVFLSIGLVILTLLARTQALTAQDRIIRLEERLRYESVLPSDLARKAVNLEVGQIIALRFASDAELPALVERTLNGDFEKPNDIKLAIKAWWADYLRV